MSNLVVAWAIVHRSRGYIIELSSTKRAARHWVSDWNREFNAGRRSGVWVIVRLEGRQ